MLVRMLSWLPLRVARGLGFIVAEIAWLLGTRSARTTTQNVDYCYPDLDSKQRQRFAKESLRHSAYTIFETPIIWHASNWRLQRWLGNVIGESLLVKASRSTGAVLIGTHFGNWEILPFYITTVTRFTDLYNPAPMHNLESLITELRQREGFDLVPINFSGLKSLRSRLNEGGVVSVFVDQVPEGGKAVVSSFLGRPTSTGTLAQSLLRKTDRACLIFAAKRTKRGFDIHIQRVSSDVHSEDLEVATSALNRAVEEVVALDPHQYQWEYKRFRLDADIYR